MVGIIVFKVFLALVLVGYVSETLYSICVFTKLTQTTNKKMKDMGLILKKDLY